MFELDLWIILTFSEKNPCLFSPSMIEPEAIVFIVSVMVLRGFFSFGSSSWMILERSPHYERVECIVLFTS